MQYAICLDATGVDWHLGTYVASLCHACSVLSLHPAFCGSNYIILFVDFLWSGILVFLFSFGAWWKIRKIQKTARSTQRENAYVDRNQLTANAKKKDPLNKFKRRVLNIAIQTSACLLLNMVRLAIFELNSLIPKNMIRYYSFSVVDVGCHNRHSCGS